MGEVEANAKRVMARVWMVRGVEIAVLIGLVCFAYLGIQSARTSAQFSAIKNNLKTFGIAVHNYHDTYNTLLLSSRNKDGVEMHGWQISLLPFMQDGYIYSHIDFNQTWTAEQNRKWLQQTIQSYLNPQITPQKDSNGYALTSYSANKHLIDFNTSVRFGDIKDGLSTTLLIGEIRDELPPWGKPGNSRDPALGINKSPKGFGGTFYNGCLFVMADGSVRHISEEVDTKIIEALGTPAGGETIRDEKF